MTRPRYFAIFGAMRTGSNLLERTLDDHEGLVGLGEAFNPSFIGGPGNDAAFGWTLEARNRDPVGFLNAVIAAHPGQIPGFRVFSGHDARIIDHAARDPQCAKFILTRDPLDSHLSLKIARETNQWMVRKAENRKLTRVEFDPAEFEVYQANLDAHYAGLRARMRAAGQAWFEIDYDDLGALDVLNGAAAYAGSAEVKDRVAPKIQRQNPPSAADKVVNPEALSEIERGRAAPKARALTPDFSALKSFYIARGVDVICAPVPGVADFELRAFLSGAQAVAGEMGQKFVDGLKPKQIERRRSRGSFAFSFVRHPADRIRAVYDRFIVRKLPPPGLGDLPDLVAERTGAAGGFAAFLDFVEDNLLGRTAAAYHPAWAPQADLLAAYAAETPVDFIGRAERVGADAAYILDRLGLADDGLTAQLSEAFAAPLAPDLDPETEARIERIFGADYDKLGYKRRS